MKLNGRDLVIVLVLVAGVLGAAMASNSSSNLALAATTCGINGCVSTPLLSSSTSYQYTGTSVSTISGTSTTVSTSISSSTTTTTATTTSTFFSYTSTISTTVTPTSYSTVYTNTQTSQGTSVSTIPTTTTTASTYTVLITSKGVSASCPVSYVTNGNRLQPYAAFLRTFRDKIQNTTAGNAFMATFNAWYYSWAPTVTYSAATNPVAYRAVQVTVVPLIGILYASYYAYELTAPLSAEAAAIMAGVVAATLVGMVYVAPVAYISTRILRNKRFRMTKLNLGPSAAWFIASVSLCALAYATASTNILAIATSSVVLSTLSLASLIGTRALAYVQVPITNYAHLALLVKRFSRTFP